MGLFAETDDGFVGYVQTSHDPGYSLIFATILFCAICYGSLPFLVALGNRLDVKNKKQQEKQQRWKTQQQKEAKRIRNMMDPSENEGSVDPIFEATEGPPSPSANGGDHSVISTQSAISITPSVSSIASLHSRRTRKRHRRKRHKRTMEKRNGWEEFELRMQRYDAYVDDVIEERGTETVEEISTSKTHGHAEDNNISASAKTVSASSPSRRQQQQRSRETSPVRSILGPLDQDAVSMGDAISITASSPGRKEIPPRFLRSNHLMHPTINIPTNDVSVMMATEETSFWHALLDLVTWDFETRRIIKLAVPFATQALSTGILDIITAAVIGKVLGTKEISAFVTVRALIDVSSSFFGGYHESIATLCSQAMGKNNVKLVGHYVQLSIIFYVCSYIPFIMLWWVYMPAILAWLGFDEETVAIGQGYNQVYLFLELLDGVDESIHGLLDVIDLESYSTLIGVSQEVVTFLDILATALLAKPSLYIVGLIELSVAVVFLAVNLGTIAWRGWFQPYREGLIGSCALYNKSAVKLMLSTSCALSVGYLLTDGEWEILTLFARYMGPAEVVAWGIIGLMWETLERFTEAVADASEVRTAFLLGSGQPAKAKRSAYKSIFMGVFLSLFLTSILFMAGEDIAVWFSNDPALQHIIADLLPLFGIGNVTLTVGTICWTLLGAQGRYRLATCIAAAASWIVTLPLAALFTFVLKINMQGQTAAVVIGYMVSGTIMAYFLFRSDWVGLSTAVQAANEAAEVSSPGKDQSAANSISIKFSSSSSKPATPKTASPDKDEVEGGNLLSSPSLGHLGTLPEESFLTACSGEFVTPKSSPKKELV